MRMVCGESSDAVALKATKKIMEDPRQYAVDAARQRRTCFDAEVKVSEPRPGVLWLSCPGICAVPV